MSHAVYRKQTCYLCEMPRSPWAVIHDFTEIICRSCVNYEGADRIETILASARRIRGSYGMSDAQQQQQQQQLIKREATSVTPPFSASQPPPIRMYSTSAATLEGTATTGGGFSSMSHQPSDQTNYSRRSSNAVNNQSFTVCPPAAGAPLVINGVLDKLSAAGAETRCRVGAAVPINSRPRSNVQTRLDQVSSSSNAHRDGNVTPDNNSVMLKCTNCASKLEDTHFVQCPSNLTHKFCFSCCRDSIIKQGNDAFCPSGDKCPLSGSTVPWAFMQEEIKTILGMNNLKEKS